jgi:glycosyltransferase involved in cell wall biosynthesis
MEYPNISILMPIYERNKFTEIIIENVNKLDYNKTKLELVILDDGDNERLLHNPFEIQAFEKEIYPIKLNYVQTFEGRKTIGNKRNKLVKLAKYNICAMIDSDDFYLSSYLKHSLEVMNKSKCGIVGSNQMLFCYAEENPEKKWLFTGIQCDKKKLMHEATFLFTKKHWKAMGGFANNSRGEGVKMIDGMTDKSVGLTDIAKCMVCICHSENTINKDHFKDKQEMDFQLSLADKILIRNACFPDKKYDNIFHENIFNNNFVTNSQI